MRHPVRITVVIPARNEAAFLGACLQSISAQRVRPYQVIVVDNASSDGTASVALRYDFVTLIRESHRGIASARNAGFDAAWGDVIARIDADTVLPADWVARVQEFYSDSRHDRSCMTGGCTFYNLYTGRFTGWAYGFVVHRINRLLLGYYFPWGSNSALPRQAWLAVRVAVSDRTDIHEDLDLGYWLHRNGYSVSYQSKLIVGAAARRLVTEHEQLWSYLTMWPRTLRIDRVPTWACAYPVAAAVWIGSYGIRVSEWSASVFGRRVKKT